MKFSVLASALALPAAHAFPSRPMGALPARQASASKRQFPGAVPPFDPKIQYVSNQGAHAFVAPSGADQRGPCPGLNSMANHGYFPKNGVGQMSDFIEGTAAAFGMAADLAGFLAVYGAVFDGNLYEYSIGGDYPGLENGAGLLGEPEGLAGSHNHYEGDSSPVRGDLFEYGNSYENQVSQFRQLYEMGMQNGGLIDLGLLTEFRAQRFNQSLNNNPYFFNAPFSGIIALNAAWSFMYRFMANHSAEYPEGQLDLEVLKSFYSIAGDYPDFVYTPGHERIPDNWYTRHPVDYYTIPYFLEDAIPMIAAHPEFASLGGNTGTTNSFVGIDPSNLTGGVFNADTLLEGNNLFCYSLQLTALQAPDILLGLFTDVNPAMDLLGSALNNVTDSLGCPELNNIDKNQFEQYPGYTKLKADGSY